MASDHDNSNSQVKKRRNKKKKNKVFNMFLVIFLVLILLSGGVLVRARIYTNKILDQIPKIDINEDDLGIDEETEEKLLPFEDIQNIALFGIDAVDGEVGRSDAIMILTIDRTLKKIKVTSIMRDSYVTIPGRKNKDKINHAYAFGGPELAIKTLNNSFGLNIKDFVSVDFTNLPKIIDALGGIDIDLTAEELTVNPGLNDHIRHINELNKTNSPYIKVTGPQHVDGTQALAYTRIRYTSGGDTERTHRQRVVLSQLFDKFEKTSPLQYPSLLVKFSPLFTTSLTSEEMLSLAKEVIKMGKLELEQEKFPMDEDMQDIYVNKIYYLKFDEEETKRKIHDYIFEDILPENNIKPTINKNNSNSTSSNNNKNSNNNSSNKQ